MCQFASDGEGLGVEDFKGAVEAILAKRNVGAGTAGGDLSEGSVLSASRSPSEAGSVEQDLVGTASDSLSRHTPGNQAMPAGTLPGFRSRCARSPGVACRVTPRQFSAVNCSGAW
jgi:hypothetical protein